jgi:RNA polymerase sigma-70 factor (ECF subfamily)
MIRIEIAHIEAAKSDHIVLSQLFERFWDPVFRYLIQKTADVDRAKDLTQETFLKAYRNFSKFRPQNEFSFVAWLYRIATNEANQHFRFLSRHPELHTNNEQLENILQDELRIAKNEFKKYDAFLEIHKYLKKLRSRYQTVLTLHYFEEFSFEEIADILMKNPNTIRTWHRRAIKNLQRLMEKP